MPILAIIMLFLSAFLHAIWNFLLKKSQEKYIAMGWQVILSGVLSLGLIFFTGLPPRSMWLFAITSTILEVIYFILLSVAYTSHDFSLVYPIAWGTPALLVLWSAIFLHEKLTPGGYIGLAMITAGIISIGATTLLQNRGKKPHLKGILVALSVSLMISIYTLVDGTAVKSGPTLPYAMSMFVMVPLVTTPYLTRYYGWEHFAAAWRRNPSYLLLGGLLGLVAYLLALYAYSFAPLSYSGAIRGGQRGDGGVVEWRSQRADGRHHGWGQSLCCGPDHRSLRVKSMGGAEWARESKRMDA
jgi:drug/metabolite transporter (DMT)-like permease